MRGIFGLGIALVIGQVVVVLALLAGVVYVAWHFISKFW
jgi:hypothetical protein